MENRRFKIILGVFAWLWVVSVNMNAASTLQELRQQVSTYPQATLAVLDSLQKKAVIQEYKLDYLRSCAYFKLSMFEKSLFYAKKAFNSVEIKSDTMLYRQVFMLLAESSVFSYSLEDATSYIQKGKEYAHTFHDDLVMANMLLSEGDLYRRLSLRKRAYECVFQAINLLTVKDDLTKNAYHLSHAYGFLMMYYMNDGKYSEAWQIGRKRAKVIVYIKKPLRYDNQSGFLDSKMAFLAYKLGNKKKAEFFYEKFLQTDFSKTYVGRLEINDYLLAVQDYGQVIANAQAYVKEMDLRDTLNLSYVRLLQQACVAYEATGNYQSAYYVAKRRLLIQQSMRLNNERNYLLENADLFNTLQTKNQLEKTLGRLQNQKIMLVALSVLSLLLLFCIAGVIWINHMIRRKNKKMAYFILEIEKQKQLAEQNEWKKTLVEEKKKTEHSVDTTAPLKKAVSASSQLSGKELFDFFDRKVRGEKLYLNYQLGRDDYAHIMGSDKNRFAAVLKEFAGTNLSTYLNNLRLEYSIELFRQHPDWSINEIAAQSALPNLSTFYRLFKDKYGMSPHVFRQQI